jgi:hypothetical protein
MREHDVRRICAERGITISRRGVAYVFTGPGISLICADLWLLNERDFEPAYGYRQSDMNASPASL